MITDPLTVFFCLAGITALCIWLEPRWRLVKALSSVMCVIILAAVLANVGVLPFASPTYSFLTSYGVQLAVILILLRVHLGQVRRAGPKMLLAFAIACGATMVGALVGTAAMGKAVGPEAWKLAAMYTGTYTGGSVNFAALGNAVEVSSGMFVAANAADNVATTAWLALCFGFPVWLARWWRARPADWPAGDARDSALDETARPVTLADVAILGALTLGILLASGWLGRRFPSIPVVLWTTTLALVVAQIPGVYRLAGGGVFGHYLLHLFLAAIGASAALSEIARTGLPVLWFALIVVSVHGLILYVVGRLADLDLGVLTVASQATVGGPPTAMAIAASKSWPGLVVPGLVAGMLGYAVGSYLGYVVAHIARQF